MSRCPRTRHQSPKGTTKPPPVCCDGDYPQSHIVIRHASSVFSCLCLCNTGILVDHSAVWELKYEGHAFKNHETEIYS